MALPLRGYISVILTVSFPLSEISLSYLLVWLYVFETMIVILVRRTRSLSGEKVLNLVIFDFTPLNIYNGFLSHFKSSRLLRKHSTEIVIAKKKRGLAWASPKPPRWGSSRPPTSTSTSTCSILLEFWIFKYFNIKLKLKTKTSTNDAYCRELLG